VAVVLLAVLAGAAGCRKGASKPPEKTFGEQVAGVEADTAALREANGAVNEVIRNSGDCDLARPLIAPANTKLDEVGRRLRTAAGRATLESLRAQLKRVSDNCP
jgi:hypothetical protein